MIKTGITIDDAMGQRLGEFLGIKRQDLPIVLIITFEQENQDDIKKYYLEE